MNKAMTFTLAGALLVSTSSIAMDMGNGKMPGSDEAKAQMAAMEKMHHAMDITYTNDADVDFATGMIPHHQGAVDMAKVELQYGKDPELRKLAESIVKNQKAEIKQMQAWLNTHKKP